MKDIWGNLARCETPGEVKRMVKGTNWGLVERGEVERLRSALEQIARGDYNSYAGNPSEWPAMIAYKALGGRHKDGIALDPELFGYEVSEARARG